MELTVVKEQTGTLPEAVVFLQKMYTSSTIPICILNEAFQVVWHNHAIRHICPEIISPGKALSDMTFPAEVLSRYLEQGQDFCDCFQVDSVFAPFGFVLGKIPIAEKYYYMQARDHLDKNDWRNPVGLERALNAFETVMRKGLNTILQGLSGAEHPDLKKIEHGADNLYRTMLMTIDYARLLGGMYSNIPIQIELHSFLSNLLECAGQLIEATGTEFYYTCPDGVNYTSTQPVLLATILCHLISNAVRHGAEKNVVHVEVVTYETEFQISISNQGNGIPTDVFPHIYEAYQSYSPSAFDIFPGYGLGLSIAQAGAVFLEGSISGFSQADRTVFRLILPLNSYDISYPELDHELPGYADYQSFVKIILADCL